MKKWLALLALLPLGMFLFPNEQPAKPTEAEPAAVGHSISKKPINVRLLVLKHSREFMADGDANLAIRAAENAAGKGLNIKNIGNHYFTRPVNSGEDFVAKDEFTNILMNPDEKVRLERFQTFVSTQMKIEPRPNDTLVIFTIGHGGTNGGLHNIGQRSDVMKALARAAEENHQRVIWWQLSCHASANLPSITTLSPSQQKLFSVVASSNAAQESVADLQGKIMDRLFCAMAEGNAKLDLNGDGIITATELYTYLRSGAVPRQGGGPIVYALTPSTVMFGARAMEIPIVDKIGPQGKYPEDYIPVP